MANVTFSSPGMAKDKTVYAIAGHRGTLLSIAKAHGIPIPFDCGDGECGSCAVRVSNMEGGLTNMGGMLTDKEKEVLRALGKISKEDIERAYVDDIPPPWRLACQMIVRDEDIRVDYPQKT